MELIYVSHEFPSVSQTFVWNEFKQIRQQFPVARLFALHERRGFEKSVISLKSLLRSPTAWWRIGPCLVRVLVSPAWWSFARTAGGMPTMIRKLFALINGIALAAQCETRRQHFHAHFMGRTLEVAYIATLALPAGRASLSATGHAGDVIGRTFHGDYRQAVSVSKFLVAASEAVRYSLNNEFPTIPNEVIHCGVDPAPIGRAATAPQNRLTLLTVARVVDKKGYDVGIDVAAEMVRRGRNFRWIAIGAGPSFKRLAQRSAPLESKGVWCWLGAQPHKEVLRRLDEETAIFVLPCVESPNGDVDGIPVALMEAMARGIPVVTSDVGGIRELVIDGTTGRLLKPGDREGFVAAIERLCDQFESRQRLGLAGRSHVLCHFSQELEAKKLARLFDLALGQISEEKGVEHRRLT
jgi:glycosyltransferase involved in cell wall biosynthesis